jgi:dihydroorotate dehydrogenase (fumarate)
MQKSIEGAGADALELNIYSLQLILDVSSADIEKNYIDILKQVKSVVNIPVAVKLAPFLFSSKLILLTSLIRMEQTDW